MIEFNKKAQRPIPDVNYKIPEADLHHYKDMDFEEWVDMYNSKDGGVVQLRKVQREDGVYLTNG